MEKILSHTCLRISFRDEINHRWRKEVQTLCLFQHEGNKIDHIIRYNDQEGGRERERERERERDRERQRDRDRQRDRQRDRETQRERDRERERETDRQRETERTVTVSLVRTIFQRVNGIY